MKPDKRQKPGRLYGVGVGPGSVRYLTLQALDVLQNADVLADVAGPNSAISISRDILDKIEGCRGERIHLHAPMVRDKARRAQCWRENAEKVYRYLKDGKDVAYVTLGDPLIYSTFSWLREQIRRIDPSVEIAVVPGITSFQAAAAKRGEPLLENEDVLTLMPATASPEKRKALCEVTDAAVILKAYREKEKVLLETNRWLDGASCYYVSRPGMANEFATDSLVEACNTPDEYLSLAIMRRRQHES